MFLAPIHGIWRSHAALICICLRSCLQSVKTMPPIVIFLLMRTCVRYIEGITCQRKREKVIKGIIQHFWEARSFAFFLKVRWECDFHVCTLDMKLELHISFSLE